MQHRKTLGDITARYRRKLSSILPSRSKTIYSFCPLISQKAWDSYVSKLTPFAITEYGISRESLIVYMVESNTWIRPGYQTSSIRLDFINTCPGHPMEALAMEIQFIVESL